jgi:predicted NAD/FAD-dependent oxidoreductase
VGESFELGIDHGCQLFRADSEEFRKEVLADWLCLGVADEWKGRFGSLGPAGQASFFGLGRQDSFSQRVFCGKNGMGSISQGLLHHHGIPVLNQAQVTRIERNHATDKWVVQGAGEQSFGDFDVVVLAAGSTAKRIELDDPHELVARHSWSPLFTALVALEQPINVDLDGILFDHPVLWFASRNESKPGVPVCGGRSNWTLISTQQFAQQELARKPLRDASGQLIPQSQTYLTGPDGPARLLLNAFQGVLGERGVALSAVQKLGGQRWGGALPVPLKADQPFSTIAPGLYFVHDCSQSQGFTTPVESVALSALHCAKHIVERYCPPPPRPSL